MSFLSKFSIAITIALAINFMVFQNVFTMCVVIAALIFICVNFLIENYRNDQLEKIRAKAQADTDELRVEIKALKDRFELMALARFGR